MRRRALALSVSLLALALLAPAADAAWFGAQPIDGPAPIAALGNVSIGRDGRGGVVYVKQEGDNPAGYLSRFLGGWFGAPERLAGADGVSDIQVAAGENGRLAVAWISNGNVYATLADGRYGAPLSAPVKLSGAGGASNLDVSLGSEGGAYAVWSQNGDVRAAFLEGTTWTALSRPLDIDPAHVAGQGAGHPRVAVAADDTALVAWGELDGAGVSHVWYRRLLYTKLSGYPKEASIAGQGAADSPQIRVEYDRSYAWVVFRQDSAGGSHTFARRMRGSEFDAPVGIDAGIASTAPSLAMNPTGAGMTAASGTDGSVLGALFADAAFHPVMRLDGGGSAAPQEPVTYYSDRGDGAVAYRKQGGDGNSIALGRLLPGGAVGPETTLSSPTAGNIASGSLRLSGDRVGDAVLVMLQGAPGAYTLTAAVQDIPPTPPGVPVRYVNPRTRGFVWNSGLDYLGPQRFRLQVDGRVVGTTRTTRLRTASVPDGRHNVQITAIDRRGQTAVGRVSPVYTDTHYPRETVSTSRSGRVLHVSIRGSDPGARGSGVSTYTVFWGDGTRDGGTRGEFVHRYASAGRKPIRVIVRDKARNETVKRLRG